MYNQLTNTNTLAHMRAHMRVHTHVHRARSSKIASARTHEKRHTCMREKEIEEGRVRASNGGGRKNLANPAGPVCHQRHGIRACPARRRCPGIQVHLACPQRQAVP